MSDRRTRRAIAVTVLALFGLLIPARLAFAGTTDVTWSLTESWKYYGGPTQFHISTGASAADYRWLDSDLTRTTIIGAAACNDYSSFGSATIGGGDTDYHNLFNGFANQCFVLRGHTPSGTGSTTTHDGRVRR